MGVAHVQVTYAILQRATFSGSHASPVPGRSGMCQCPSIIGAGSCASASVQSTYSSQSQVGVAASRCALTSGVDFHPNLTPCGQFWVAFNRSVFVHGRPRICQAFNS